MSFTWWRYPTRRWSVDGRHYRLVARARTDALVTELWVDGQRVSEDRTPLGGPEAIRNHRHHHNGLDIEAGYVSLWAVGATARRGDRTLYESHPGRTIAYPESYRDMAVAMGDKPLGGLTKQAWREGGTQATAQAQAAGVNVDSWRNNRIPLMVDLACGLLFYVLAKAFGLTEAALAMAAVGIALVVAQRLTRIDLTGGLALFGIVMTLIGAGYALAFRDEQLIKLRGTILGSLTATLFLVDGLLGGRRLAGKLARYMPFTDLDTGRLGIGMGVMGLIMALLNFAVARLTSTDVWLFYTTFLDTVLILALMVAVLAYARGRWPRARGKVHP